MFWKRPQHEEHQTHRAAEHQHRIGRGCSSGNHKHHARRQRDRTDETDGRIEQPATDRVSGQTSANRQHRRPKSSGKLIDTENAVSRHHQPVQQRRFMRTQLAVENRNHPIVSSQHLCRAACITRLIAIPEPRRTEIRKENRDGHQQNDGNLCRSAFHGCACSIYIVGMRKLEPLA